MTTPSKPDETWTTGALFERAVQEATSDVLDDDAYWGPIHCLQSKDPAEVWALVAPLALAPDPRLRCLVPDILRFLGGRPQPLLDATLQLLGDLLRAEQAAIVIRSVALAFVDLSHPVAVDLLVPFASHPDAEVRESVVHGLLPVADKVVTELIRLSDDPCEDVRNWATFGLGSQLGSRGAPDLVDTPEIRDALARRLQDPHGETRAEAALGLAIRGDRRAVPAVQEALAGDFEWDHYVEAAGLLGDRGFYQPLLKLSEEGYSSSYLAEAIEACRPLSGKD